MGKVMGRPKKDKTKKRVLITIDSSLHQFYLDHYENFSGLVEELLQNKKEKGA